MSWGKYPMRPAEVPHGSDSYQRLMDSLWDFDSNHGVWRAEPKMDGVRCLARVSPGGVELMSRHLKPIYNPKISDALKTLVFDASSGLGVFDGELYQGVYRIFDAPNVPGTLWQRCNALTYNVSGWSQTVNWTGALNDIRADPWDYVMENGYEGLVLKRFASEYSWGRSPRETTTQWIKVKP